MEDYKTKYEKLIQRIDDLTANGLIDKGVGKGIIEDFTTFESKDEKIRKALIESFKIHDLKALIILGFSAKDVIDWLERVGKQNEQNFEEKCKHCECFDGYDFCSHRKNFGSITDESIENCKNNNLFIEKQVEQKLTDKVEPKFKVGDKITNGENIYTINNIVKDCYFVKEHDCVEIPFEYQDKWNLVEPKFKVGDIITNKKSKDTVKIVQILHDSYCYSGWDGAATVHSDFRISEQDNWELVWSEEDEKMLNSIIEVLEVTPSARFVPIKREIMIPWLESIKERMKR